MASSRVVSTVVSVVLGTMVDVDPDAVHTGMPVKVVYEEIPDEDVTIWHFAPDD